MPTNSTTRHRSWQEVFGYSVYATGIWFDREGLGDLTGALTSRTMTANYTSTSGGSRYADGGYYWNSPYGLGLDSDDKAGRWVIGWAAMRFLCYLHNIDAPERRLKDEPFAPNPDLLAYAVGEQLRSGRATMGEGGSGVMSYHADGDRRRDPHAPFDHLHESSRVFWERLHEIHLLNDVDPLSARSVCDR